MPIAVQERPAFRATWTFRRKWACALPSLRLASTTALMFSSQSSNRLTTGVNVSLTSAADRYQLILRLPVHLSLDRKSLAFPSFTVRGAYWAPTIQNPIHGGSASPDCQPFLAAQ
jgi:hypothetical protein